MVKRIVLCFPKRVVVLVSIEDITAFHETDVWDGEHDETRNATQTM